MRLTHARGRRRWLGALIVLLGALLALDLRVFARGREPSFREGVAWSAGWLVVALAAAVPVCALSGSGDAGSYVTVYLIERTLSLDNLFVFLLLFAYFRIPPGTVLGSCSGGSRRRSS